MNNLAKFQEQIGLAKLATLNKKHFAFIGSMLYKLNLKPNSTYRDIYLDGLNHTIHINPDWFTNLSPEYASAMLAHEVLHYSLQHDIRQGGRLPDIYQKACDQVVNNMLMDFGFKLPPDIEVDRRYQNQSVDVVYKQILQDQSNDPDGDNDNDDGTKNQSGGNDLPKNQSPPDQHQQNQRNRALNQADMADKASGSKSIGNSNEAFSELFKSINKGKLSWKQILAEYFNEITEGEPSYHDLDRRMLALGYYEPVREEENAIHRVALALDVSGSVTKYQIKHFLQEIKAIANNLNPEIISVMTFNHSLVEVKEFKRGDDLSQINIDIGGGTNLEPVVQHYNEPKNLPEFLVVFSDLEVYGYPEQPKYPVIWMCFDNDKAKVPYGKLIHINSEDLDD